MTKPAPSASGTDRPASPSRRPGPWHESLPQAEPRSASSLFGPTGFGGPGAARRSRQGDGSAFDVCHVGVALRAVLFVHGTIGVGVLFVANDLQGWLSQLAVAASVALPAVLMWLVSACLLNRALSLLPLWAQWSAAVGLGGASGGVVYAMQVAGGLGTFAPVQTGLAPVAGGAALAAALFYWLTLRARARLPADTTARLAELQSRIRPHFLFNTLNTAIALARLDPARTEGLLEDLAELFRVALTDTGESVTLSDEVALAKRYLAIEQVRFGERLQVTWELDDDAGTARVPPLLLQPLVENAVRHGVEPSPEGGVVRIRTRVKRAHAVVSIVNTLPASASRPGNGIAMRNVHERLKLMHDVSARFDIQSDGKVYRVQIVVPL